ncbi:hypothetical protein TKK_0008499 [Trichogramma kaykai]
MLGIESSTRPEISALLLLALIQVLVYLKKMSAITHAKVKFAQDKKILSVPVENIVQFKSKPPAHKKDYDDHFLYTCIWTDSKNPTDVRLAVLVGGFACGEKESVELLKERSSFPTISNSDLDEFSAATEEECEMSQELILQESKLQQREAKLNMEVASLAAARKNLNQLKRSQNSLSQDYSDSEDDYPLPNKKQKCTHWADSEDEDEPSKKSNESKANTVKKNVRCIDSDEDDDSGRQIRDAMTKSPLDFSTNNSGILSEHALNKSQEILAKSLTNSSDQMSHRASVSQSIVKSAQLHENGPSTSAQNALIDDNQEEEINGLVVGANPTGQQEEIRNANADRQRRKKKHYRLFRLKESYELPAPNPDDLIIKYKLPDGGLDVEENGMSTYDTFENDTKLSKHI